MPLEGSAKVAKPRPESGCPRATTTPNVVSHNTAVSPIERGNHWEETLRLLLDMAALGARLGVRPVLASGEEAVPPGPQISAAAPGQAHQQVAQDSSGDNAITHQQVAPDYRGIPLSRVPSGERDRYNRAAGLDDAGPRELLATHSSSQV